MNRSKAPSLMHCRLVSKVRVILHCLEANVLYEMKGVSQDDLMVMVQELLDGMEEMEPLLIDPCEVREAEHVTQ